MLMILLRHQFPSGDSLLFLSQQVLQEGADAGEFIFGIDVFFDDVEHEVIQAGGRPDDQQEQYRDLPGTGFKEDQSRGDEQDHQEQESLEVDQLSAFEVGHGWIQWSKGVSSMGVQFPSLTDCMCCSMSV